MGKTSVASATALWFSRHGKRTLLVSIDPAHSLSDSFEKNIGGEVKKLGKELYGLEMEPARAIEEFKDKFIPKLESSPFLKSMGIEDGLDIAGATPGMDEIAAFDKFLKYMGSDEYDAVVFDTAPTGHALRFLSLPDVLDSWVGKLIKIRMQFAGVAGLVGKLLPFGRKDGERENFGAEYLEYMKRRIGAAKSVLSDPGRTHFNLVLIPEEMSIFESLRSLDSLKQFGIPVEGVTVNNIIPENSGCSFCSARRSMQLSRLKTIRREFRKYKIREVPLFPGEVRGVKMLMKLGSLLYGE